MLALLITASQDELFGAVRPAERTTVRQVGETGSNLTNGWRVSESQAHELSSLE
jgi:hypothetical protein